MLPAQGCCFDEPLVILEGKPLGDGTVRIGQSAPQSCGGDAHGVIVICRRQHIRREERMILRGVGIDVIGAVELPVQLWMNDDLAICCRSGG